MSAATCASLIEQYLRQYRWRRWDQVLRLCPIAPGQQVLDLGCGPGELSRALAMLGAEVTGLDQDPACIVHAQAGAPVGASFVCSALQSVELAPASFDGIWCSFTAAYLADLDAALARWLGWLRPGGWICIVEVDDLLGHEPLAPQWRAALERFADLSRAQGKYDFHAGRRVAALLQRRAVMVTTVAVDDDELSAQGALPAEVVAAWAQRLARMGRLQAFLEDDFAAFSNDFLACLTDPAHRTSCRVMVSLALKDPAGSP